MIYAELAGGLGNQMFIYAFARALGLRCNEPVTLLDRHSSEKRLAAAFADSREAVFLFPSGAGTAKTARDLAADGTRTVLLISPYWLTSRDASGQPGRRYVNLRQEQAHVFCIRRSFFFCARRLAQEQGLELTVVY